jgi:ribosome-associated translation inhibitor RaiA
MSTDLFLQNNPNLRPRAEVRIERVTATPYPDRRRVHVEVEVTPFREQPNLEITINAQNGRVAASTTVVALMNFKVAFNLHLRGTNDPAGPYTVQVRLYYEDVESAQDAREAQLDIPPANSSGSP